MKTFNKAIIFYFSGTGNSRQIASWFSACAAENKVSCPTFDIASKDIAKHLQEIDSDSIIIIVSPIHGFNYPQITLDFIRNFPKGNNQVVLMNTRAGMKIGNWITPGLTGVAFFLSTYILKKKGYHIVGQIPFDMPSNWLSIHPALRKDAIRFIYEKNHKSLQSHFNKLYTGEIDFASRKEVIQDLLISPIALAYYLVGRYFFAKSYYASLKCNHCERCIRECPVKAIRTINSRPFWSIKCESCMKCMNNCPLNAIETTHGLWLVILLLASSTGTFLFHYILPNVHLPWMISFLIFNLLLFAFLLIGYRIQHWALSHKLIAKLITFTSLTHYKWWGRYKANQDQAKA